MTIPLLFSIAAEHTAIAFGVVFGLLALVVAYLLHSRPPGSAAVSPTEEGTGDVAPGSAAGAEAAASLPSAPSTAAAAVAEGVTDERGDDGWTETEIAEVGSIAMATHERGGDANNYLEGHFGAGGPNLPDYDPSLYPALVPLLNFWGVVLRQRGEADEALDMFEHALEHAETASAGSRQELVYNRGYARMETTMIERSVMDVQLPEGVLEAILEAGASPTETMISTFPDEPDEETQAAWELSLGDFRMAVELEPEDITAWSQVAMTSFLLATVRHDERRSPHIEDVIAAYERAREMAEPEHRHVFEEGLLACAALRDGRAPPEG